MQAHSKAYKAIAWPKLWPAPAQGRGPAHSQGQTREHCHRRGSNQRSRAQPAVVQWLSLEKWENFVEGVTSLQAAVQLPPVPAHFRSDLRHRTGSSAGEGRVLKGTKSWDAKPSAGVQTRKPVPHLREQIPSCCGGNTPEGASPAPLCRGCAEFHVSAAALCPEHPRAGLQLIRDQGGYVEPGRAGCSIPGAPAHLHPP